MWEIETERAQSKEKKQEKSEKGPLAIGSSVISRYLQQNKQKYVQWLSRRLARWAVAMVHIGHFTASVSIDAKKFAMLVPGCAFLLVYQKQKQKTKNKYMFPGIDRNFYLFSPTVHLTIKSLLVQLVSHAIIEQPSPIKSAIY